MIQSTQPDDESRKEPTSRVELLSRLNCGDHVAFVDDTVGKRWTGIAMSGPMPGVDSTVVRVRCDQISETLQVPSQNIIEVEA